ncbi:MAG: hypothetical protein QW641_00050 [Candidatus Aenigmatarchaeota archaeon]
MFDEIWSWAYRTGMIIKERDEKLLRMLIFDIRGEETPGRFLEKLSNRLCEYRTNKNIGLDVSIKSDLFKVKWHGDKFYHMKAAIMAGLTDALSVRSRENE